MLGIQWVNSHGIPELWETIRQSSNCWNFRGLDAGVKQGTNTGIAPAVHDIVEVVLEVSEDDVTVAVNQRRGGRHNRVETLFQPHSAGLRRGFSWMAREPCEQQRSNVISDWHRYCGAKHRL